MLATTSSTKPLLPRQAAPASSSRLINAAAIPALLLLCLSLLCVRVLWLPSPTADPMPSDPMERALRILERSPVIDTHNDLPIKLGWLNGGFVGNVSFYNMGPDYHTDITRLKKGRVGAQFWSAFVPCAENANACPSQFKAYNEDLRRTIDQIDVIKHIVRRYPADLEMAYTSTDIKRIMKTKKIASLIGIEGAHQMDSSIGVLRQLYDLGVRYMTLTHVCHTAWADSCNLAPLHNGITPFGKTVITEMNRLGMLVDLSHVSKQVMEQVIAHSRAPVIFSHSSAFSVCPHPRNVPDDILRLLPHRDGVVQINFSNGFVTCGPGGADNGVEATVAIVADHFVHINKTIGPKHLGIGSDFDGIPATPTGLEDVSKYPNLVVELVGRGFTDEEIMGFTGGMDGSAVERLFFG
ncbi:dipeptidase 1 (renal) [Irineochytrium annulatum]|nr:dipeptidase 1 (renal) [Irineochytrium annulatum]